MALDVKYGEIRTEVIGKLVTEREDMVELLGKLDTSVDSLSGYMEGDSLNAYITEYETVVKSIYQKLNENLATFTDQLESVCKEFETLDTDMQAQLS